MGEVLPAFRLHPSQQGAASHHRTVPAACSCVFLRLHPSSSRKLHPLAVVPALLNLPPACQPALSEYSMKRRQISQKMVQLDSSPASLSPPSSGPSSAALAAPALTCAAFEMPPSKYYPPSAPPPPPTLHAEPSWWDPLKNPLFDSKGDGKWDVCGGGGGGGGHGVRVLADRVRRCRPVRAWRRSAGSRRARRAFVLDERWPARSATCRTAQGGHGVEGGRRARILAGRARRCRPVRAWRRSAGSRRARRAIVLDERWPARSATRRTARGEEAPTCCTWERKRDGKV